MFFLISNFLIFFIGHKENRCLVIDFNPLNGFKNAICITCGKEKREASAFLNPNNIPDNKF